METVTPQVPESQLIDWIRQLCAQRGIDWDKLTENQRQQLIDELLHNR